MPTFDNAFIRELPGDAEQGTFTRQVMGAMWSSVTPTPVSAPRLIGLSADMLARLGESAPDWHSPERVAVLAGNALLPGMAPWAANYGGHQFGVWAGQLGDGRAISLGEMLTASGERWEWQLKGAGPTPYSRRADGRAVLRSSLREFICSEAMHHLGVPTTRALSLVTTGDDVIRDLLYSGDPRPEPGAIVCRLSPSFLRFGSFELPASRGDRDLLQKLLDFTIRRDFPHLQVGIAEPQTRYAHWFTEACERTARLVAHWMRLGFVHGVLNTDNMSVLGLTIDYGPYGWLDNYDPDWTPNTTDAAQRRYRYAQQPSIAWWNLGRLAAAVAPLFEDHAALHQGLEAYVAEFERADQQHAADKLGLRDDDQTMTRMDALRACMSEGEIDMTLFFRRLSSVDPQQPTLEPFEAAFYSDAGRLRVADRLIDWLQSLAAQWRVQNWPAAQRVASMNACNPCYVPRNYVVQQLIERVEAGEAGVLEDAMAVFSRPYEVQSGREGFAGRRPDWAMNRPGCSALSCSS